jgi:hypothetical protein
VKLGVMQPYLFPYIGYFDLICRVDQWVVFDTAQYPRHGWVNRNRILHPVHGWQYIIAPVVKHRREARICDVQVIEDRAWCERIEGQLVHYRRRAPYFDVVMSLVRDCLNVRDRSLARLNVEALRRICTFLGIPFNYMVFSEMNLPLGPIERPGDWALRIAEALGAREYVNPPGGRALFDPARFAVSGIRLTVQESIEFRYEVPGYCFQPALSIVDALMWNSRDRLREFLAGRLETKSGDDVSSSQPAE